MKFQLLQAHFNLDVTIMLLNHTEVLKLNRRKYGTNSLIWYLHVDNNNRKWVNEGLSLQGNYLQ